MSRIQPVYWGQLILTLASDKRLTVSRAHMALEALGNVEVDEHAPHAIHTLLGKLEGTEPYSQVATVLSGLTGVDDESLHKAVMLLQDHLTSPDDIPDHMMRQMFRSVYALFDEVSPTGRMARAVADLLDVLVREGRFPASQIDPLVGFQIPHDLFRVHRKLADEADSIYRAMYFALDSSDQAERFHELMFHVSYMVDVPVSTLERCVDKLMLRLEARKPYLNTEILTMISGAAA